jgi:hypothetical protein
MFRILPAVVIAAGLAGCAKPLPKITVLQGKVTIDGKPIKAGYVNAMSADNVTVAGGNITTEGVYRIVGAPTGSVVFTVCTRDNAETEPVFNDEGQMVARPKRNPLYTEVPEKYASFGTSGLTAVIDDDQHEFDIQLNSK